MSLEQKLAELISFKTVTGNLQETQALCEWVREELQSTPVLVREYYHGGLPSLVITPTRRKYARVWLAAHMDVTAAPDELFGARREGGRLIGRGAIDMKFAIACYVQLLQELATLVREYDLGVMLTPDEEWGIDNSTKYLLTKENFSGDVAFLPDGYGSWKFEQCAKGVYALHVYTEGVAAHGSKPWHGRSAVSELMSFLTELERRVVRMFTNDMDDEHWYTTVNIGEIEGGVAFNTVAPEAHATVDMRIARKGDTVKIERLLRSLQRTHEHTVVTVTHDIPPHGILRKNGYIQTFREVAHRHGKTCGWVKSHGNSDARFFNANNIPTVLVSPSGGGSHGDSEWIDVDDLNTYYTVLCDWVEQVARKN